MTFRLLPALFLVATLATAAPREVTVDNQTTPTRCAEEDNVSLTLTGAGVSRFTVEALQPVYLNTIQSDVTAPDFSNCNFDGGDHPTDPRYIFKPGTHVLHEGSQWRIVGITLPSFWRPQQVPVRIGGRTVRGIHLLQVFRKIKGKVLEAVVLYPSDGYWRIKPLPEARFGDGVYGSSLLLGPVVQERRPVVNIASIAITTQPLAMQLKFVGGGNARIGIPEISRTRTSLDVTLKPAAGRRAPFAVLRSMYVTPDNADMSEVVWQAAPDAAPQALPLPEVSSLKAADVRFGRRIPSRHNTSAPDIRFSHFR